MSNLVRWSLSVVLAIGLWAQRFALATHHYVILKNPYLFIFLNIKRDCRLYCSVPGCGRAFLPWVCIFSPCLCGFPLGTVIINTCRRTVTILDWIWLHVTINYLLKVGRWADEFFTGRLLEVFYSICSMCQELLAVIIHIKQHLKGSWVDFVKYHPKKSLYRLQM